MKNVRVILNGQPAFVSFLCRYRDENDYQLEQMGRRPGRCRRTDDGQVSTNADEFSIDEARVALAAYDAAEAEQYAQWMARQANG